MQDLRERKGLWRLKKNSIECLEELKVARMEIGNLMTDYETYSNRVDELVESMDRQLTEMTGDSVRFDRLTAIEGSLCKGPCKAKEDVLLRVLKSCYVRIRYREISMIMARSSEK